MRREDVRRVMVDDVGEVLSVRLRVARWLQRHGGEQDVDVIASALSVQTNPWVVSALRKGLERIDREVCDG